MTGGSGRVGGSDRRDTSKNNENSNKLQYFYLVKTLEEEFH